MDKFVEEIKRSVEVKDTFGALCESLVSFFENAGKDDGFQYFRSVLAKMSPMDWFTDENDMPVDFMKWDATLNERMTELAQIAGNLISKQIDLRVSEDAFYEELWRRIQDDIVLPTAEDRAVFFSLLWSDNRIPYFQIGTGVKVDDESFQQITEKIRPSIQKGIFIVNANIHSKTQRGSLLMDVANSLDDDQERIVFWGIIIGHLRGRVSSLLSSLMEEQNKAESGGD